MTAHVQSNSNILLQTAEVILENPSNSQRSLKVKALFDSGSQRTYVSEKVKNALNLNTESKENVNIATFGNSKSTPQIIDRVHAVAKTKGAETVHIEAYTVPLICPPLTNQPVQFAKCSVGEFQGLDLADSGSGSNEIDLLIGSDCYWAFVTGRVQRGSADGVLVAMETKLGWVLSGPVMGSSGMSNDSINLVQSHVLKVDFEVDHSNALETQLSRFGDLETMGVLENEKECM